MLRGVMLPPCGRFKDEPSWRRHAAAKHEEVSYFCHSLNDKNKISDRPGSPTCNQDPGERL